MRPANPSAFPHNPPLYWHLPKQEPSVWSTLLKQAQRYIRPWFPLQKRYYLIPLESPCRYLLFRPPHHLSIHTYRHHWHAKSLPLPRKPNPDLRYSRQAMVLLLHSYLPMPYIYIYLSQSRYRMPHLPSPEYPSNSASGRRSTRFLLLLLSR